jgi:hypothetical protein
MIRPMLRQVMSRFFQSADTDLAFESLGRQFLSLHPEIQHEWRNIQSFWDGGRTDLVCAPGQANEVFASLRSWQITIGSHGNHEDFEAWGRKVSSEHVAREAFNFFVELLRKNGLMSTSSRVVA